MKSIRDNIFSFRAKFLLIAISCSLTLAALSTADSRFTVVIDAGHGGHDSGAKGSIILEKDINLSVVLKLGQIIELNYRDVKVVYTRKTDKYLTLQERADIVNNNHADLFICIHTNASTSPAAYGSETFTLGLAKSKANLDVAMRENSVILLEEDYRTKYKGFDPASVDSYIMFEFMQDKYIDKSVELASNIQKQFVAISNRSDRGVRQAGFWVLHRSACPSVLVELGFISNPSEETYLASEKGQDDLAKSVFVAFTNFKKMHDKRSGKQLITIPKTTKKDEKKASDLSKTTEEEDSAAIPEENIDEKQDVGSRDIVKSKPSEIKTEENTAPIFKVQLFASRKQLPSNSSYFKGVKDIQYYFEDGMYKYTLGADKDYNAIEKIRKNMVENFPQAYIIAFIGDKKITYKEALKLLKN